MYQSFDTCPYKTWRSGRSWHLNQKTELFYNVIYFLAAEWWMGGGIKRKPNNAESRNIKVTPETWHHLYLWPDTPAPQTAHHASEWCRCAESNHSTTSCPPYPSTDHTLPVNQLPVQAQHGQLKDEQRISIKSMLQNDNCPHSLTPQALPNLH